MTGTTTRSVPLRGQGSGSLLVMHRLPVYAIGETGRVEGCGQTRVGAAAIGAVVGIQREPRDVGQRRAGIWRHVGVTRHVHDDMHVGKPRAAVSSRLGHAAVGGRQIARRRLSISVGADEEAVAVGLAFGVNTSTTSTEPGPAIAGHRHGTGMVSD